VASNATTFESPRGPVSIIERQSGGTAFGVGQAVGDAFSAAEGVAQAVAGATIFSAYSVANGRHPRPRYPSILFLWR